MDGIFISYRRDDAAGYAGRLYDRLVGHFGPEQVFMDVEGIEPGLDFVEAIERAVGSCRVLIVIIGDEWTTVTDAAGRRRLDDPHDFIRLETGTALRRKIRVVPVLVGGAVMPHADELPDELKSLTRRQAIDINHKQWESSSGELIRALEGILTAGIAATDPASSQPMPIAPKASTSTPTPTPARTGPAMASAPVDAAGPTAPGHARLWALLAAAIAISAAVGWWAAGRPDGPEQNTARDVVTLDAPRAVVAPPAPAAVQPAEPASAAAVAAPAVTAPASATATAAPSATTLAQSPAPAPASVSASTPDPSSAPATAAIPEPAPKPIEPTAPPGPDKPPPATSTQAAPRPASPAEQLPVTVTAAPPPPAPPGTSGPPPVIRTFTADPSATQVRLCYRVTHADSLDLSPRPGALAVKERDCVTVPLNAPAIFTLTARNSNDITRKRLAVVPKAAGTAKADATTRADATPDAATPSPAHNATVTANATLPVAGERWVYRSSGKWRTSPKRRIEVVARSVAATVVTDALTVLEPDTTGGAEERRSRGDKPDFIGWKSIGPEFSPYFGAFVDLLQQGPFADLPTPDLDPVWSRWQSRVTVLGPESITVPAGTFDAIKVEVWSSRGQTGTSSQARLEPVRVHYLIWYAPQVKRYVRMQRRVTAADNSESEKDEFELVSYQPR